MVQARALGRPATDLLSRETLCSRAFLRRRADPCHAQALYNRLPPASGTRDKRTFIVLPPAASPVADCFEAVEESGAADEVDAHTTMFTRFSPGYATMGLRKCQVAGSAGRTSRLSLDPGAAAIVSFSLDNEQEVIGRAQAAALQASGVKQEAAA